MKNTTYIPGYPKHEVAIKKLNELYDVRTDTTYLPRNITYHFTPPTLLVDETTTHQQGTGQWWDNTHGQGQDPITPQTNIYQLEDQDLISDYLEQLIIEELSLIQDPSTTDTKSHIEPAKPTPEKPPHTTTNTDTPQQVQETQPTETTTTATNHHKTTKTKHQTTHLAPRKEAKTRQTKSKEKHTTLHANTHTQRKHKEKPLNAKANKPSPEPKHKTTNKTHNNNPGTKQQANQPNTKTLHNKNKETPLKTPHHLKENSKLKHLYHQHNTATKHIKNMTHHNTPRRTNHNTRPNQTQQEEPNQKPKIKLTIAEYKLRKSTTKENNYYTEDYLATNMGQPTNQPRKDNHCLRNTTETEANTKTQKDITPTVKQLIDELFYNCGINPTRTKIAEKSQNQQPTWSHQFL